MQVGLQQLINEPTHLTGKSSLCIDLNFTSQPNPVMESGVHSSLHPNCRHQIVFARFVLKMFHPPPYRHEIWHYNKANIDLIPRSIHQFWKADFLIQMQIKKCFYLMKQLFIYSIKLSKDADKIREVKKMLKSLKFESIGINNLSSQTIACVHITKLWTKCKRMRMNEFIHGFWVSYGLIKIKMSESSTPPIIRLDVDLETMLPGNPLLKDISKN